MRPGIPNGINRQDVEEAIRDLAAGRDPEGFGPPTGYALAYGGARYAPKAVVGLAARRVLGRVLAATEFRGGEGGGQANRLLRNLGFSVVRLGAGRAMTYYITKDEWEDYRRHSRPGGALLWIAGPAETGKIGRIGLGDDVYVVTQEGKDGHVRLLGRIVGLEYLAPHVMVPFAEEIQQWLEE